MGTPRLPVAKPESERDSAGDSRRREDHRLALEASIGRITRHVSDALGTGYSMRTLEEQIQGVARSAGEVLEVQMQISRDQGRAEVDAVAPLHTLARRMGYGLAALESEGDGEADVEGAAADVGKEVSDALGRALELRRRGFRTVAHRDEARRQIAEAVASLHRLDAEVGELDEDELRAAAVAGGPR